MSPQGEHFDVVVVGSGFGGSVIAYRLAEAGRCASACWSAARPTRPARSRAARTTCARNFWDPSEGLHGHVRPVVVPRPRRAWSRAGSAAAR